MKRIFDPIHHFIELDDTEVALLDTRPMQRLRRLRQLGLAYLAFPAAEHSRFSHALGALAMGERVFESLRNHGGSFADERDYQQQRRLLRVSLLLHDVGHGPFSHACEAVLGIAHETRTSAILALDEMRGPLEALEIEPREVLALVTGDPPPRNAVLKELVSGPNLDADRMDYLQRDAYFTGVAGGRYDVDQLVGLLRMFELNGSAVLGVDGRGLVALESFVLARYMMFATVYFHHTTRMFERVLQEALREIWPDPRALDAIETFLEWDDARVFEALRASPSPPATALRERHKLFALAAEFNAEHDLTSYDACLQALRERFGDDVWADEQQQLVHRLPLIREGDDATVPVLTQSGIVDATRASDLIGKLAGPAFWRKIFVRRDRVDVDEARDLCRAVSAVRSAR